jgi:pyruvate kinase
MVKQKYNKTKIIATIGPATSSREMLQKIILAGVDTCRLNFSHGSHEDHLKVIQRVQEINKELGTKVALLGDLQGPKLRIGKTPDQGIQMKRGSHVILTTREAECTAEKIYVSYPRLATDIKPGERVLLDDGKVEFVFTEILNKHEVKAKVVVGGKLTSNKGFNLPQSDLSVPSLTKKDQKDLAFILEHNLDWVALSFVRHASDIVGLKRKIKSAGCRTKIIAKIEKPQAVDNFDDILEQTDGVMVARGDLGVEIPMERVPMIQKSIVEKCIIASKPVIIATQMMESMIENATPTRAEVNDVANAVMDGADAVMLSGETSVGKYPLRVIQKVERILGSTELGWNIYYKGTKPNPKSPSFLSDEICFTAVRMSDHIDAKAIISMTQTGYTAFKIASFRPNCDVFIFTSNKEIMTQLNLLWNIRVFYYDKMSSTDQTIKDVLTILKGEKLLKKNDLVVHTAAMPVVEKRKTNTLKISRVE